MATNTRGITYDFPCPIDKRIDTKTLRYLGVAASVGLPKALFLGRIIVRVIKPRGPAVEGVALRAAGAKRAVKRSRGGKKK